MVRHLKRPIIEICGQLRKITCYVTRAPIGGDFWSESIRTVDRGFRLFGFDYALRQFSDFLSDRLFKLFSQTDDLIQRSLTSENGSLAGSKQSD